MWIKIVGRALVGLFLLTACQPAPYMWHGAELNAAPAPDFSLPDVTNGGTFRLSDQAGKLVLLYFGYTFCPDVCPATLADLKQALAAPGVDVSRVRVVFVTVDPERDTPDILKRYLGRFDPSFVGLRADSFALEPILQGYGITAIKEVDGSVTHSSSVLLIDGKGRKRVSFGFGTSAANMAQDIQHILQENT